MNEKYELAKRMAEEAHDLLRLQIVTIKARHLLADLLLSDPTPTIIFDFNGKFYYGNPAWNQITGYSNAKLTDTLLLDLIHPDDRQTTTEAMAYASKGVDPQYFVNRYRFADGKYHWVLWHPQRPANDPTHGIAFMSVVDEWPETLRPGFISSEKVKHSRLTIH